MAPTMPGSPRGVRARATNDGAAAPKRGRPRRAGPPRSVAVGRGSRRTVRASSAPGPAQGGDACRLRPMNLPAFLRSDPNRHEGVPAFNIWLLRLLFLLMATLLALDVWSAILRHAGPWDPVKAAAFCMWASYSLLSVIGVFRPLKLLPIVLFEILYKLLWLGIVAYPLWAAGTLAASPAYGMAKMFAWVVFPIVAMPWKYAFDLYVLGRPR